VKKHFTRLSRMRHSLYSLVRPLQCDEDNYNTDPLYLRDEQARCRRDAAEMPPRSNGYSSELRVVARHLGEYLGYIISAGRPDLLERDCVGPRDELRLL